MSCPQNQKADSIKRLEKGSNIVVVVTLLQNFITQALEMRQQK